jgi:AraC-like DNA-binding protein
VDVLTDVLSAMRLSGGVILEAEFSAPWCVRSQLGPDDCQPFFRQPAHVIAYHFITHGALVCQVGEQPPIRAQAGDILLLTRNDPHVLGSEMECARVDAHQLIEIPDGGVLARIHWGGGGDRTVMFCGFLGTDSPMTTVLQCLPPILKVSTNEGPRRQWLVSSLQFAAAEVRDGSAAEIARLAELLFADAVRQYVETLPPAEGGWFAALRDPAIGRALALIHDRYAEDWTADGLAREAGMSRSTFAARFAELLADSPMRYCARWRMQIAANMLRDERHNICNVAYRVGFNSEAAFSRAFKREYGSPPAQWRKLAMV